MRPTSPIVDASQAARKLRPSAFGHTFIKAVRRILDALARVPDYQPDAVSDEDIQRLHAIGESTIAAIEHRLDAGHDRMSVRLELAEAVYAIRRELEEITRWRHHYSTAGFTSEWA